MKKNTRVTPEVDSVAGRQQALGEFMRATRLALPVPTTQIKLSRALDYEYSIVSNWENGMRTLTTGQAQAWARAVGLSDDLTTGPLAAHIAALLANEQSKPNSGSRVEKGINERIKQLRRERGFTIRDMATVAGISTGHLQRIEGNHGNLTLGQLRRIHKSFKVSYEFLMDGVEATGKSNTLETLRDRVKQLERENELLEELRARYTQEKELAGGSSR